MPHIKIPEALRKFSHQSEVTLDINTLNQFERALQAALPELAKIIFTHDHKLNGFVNLYLNQEFISDNTLKVNIVRI